MTLDCFGMGRLMEAVFDGCASVWWIAGAIVLSVWDKAANDAGIPQKSYRDACVALAWVSAVAFLVLLFSNLYMISLLGKAYGRMHPRWFEDGYYTTPVYGVQMGGPYAGAPYPTAGYAGYPANYPTPPPQAPMGGHAAPPAGTDTPAQKV